MMAVYRTDSNGKSTHQRLQGGAVPMGSVRNNTANLVK